MAVRQLKPYLTNIADAIRAKLGVTDKVNAQDFPEKINEVYDKGIVKMWDAATNKGKKEMGVRFFNGADYTDIETLPYPLTPTGSCERMFYDYKGKKLPRPQYVDMSKIEGDNSSTVANLCAYWTHERVQGGVFPDYGIPALSYYSTVFAHSSGIETIEILRVKENTSFSATFINCTGLKNIIIEGVIGTSINFQYSPLSVDSMKSIITALKDYSGTDKEFAYTLTLKADCKTALEAEGTTSPNGNTWIDYINDKCWNLQ